jgi:hypothetical protein
MIGPGGRSVASLFLWLRQTHAGDRGPSKAGPLTVRARIAQATESPAGRTRRRELGPWSTAISTPFTRACLCS